MDNWDELFKNSSQQDRGFAVDPERWYKLELELEQSRKRKLLFWWFSGGSTLLVLSLSIWGLNINTAPNLGAFKIPGIGTYILPRESSAIKRKPIVNAEGAQEKLSTPKVVVNKQTVLESSKESIFTKIKENVEKKSTLLSEEMASGKDKVEARVGNQVPKEETLKSLNKQASRIIRSRSSFKTAQSNSGPSIGTSVAAVKLEMKPWEKTPKTGWLIQASVGMKAVANFKILGVFTTTLQDDIPVIIYTKGNGDRLLLNRINTPFSTRKDLQMAYQFSVFYQYYSGFLINVGLGFNKARYDSRSLLDQVTLTPDILYSVSYYDMRNWHVHVGVQYQFMKTKRLRPHIGLSMSKVFTQTTSVAYRSFMPANQFEELDGVSTGRLTWNAPSNLFVEFGGQYQLDQHWSVGIQGIFGPREILTEIGTPFALSSWFTAGFEVQVRYRLEKRKKKK